MGKRGWVAVPFVSDETWARMMSNVAIDTNGAGCWEWCGNRMKNGYGRIYVEGRRILAHRVFLAHAIGGLPSGVDALHKCDNPPCVNPAHLFVGTHADNMRDMSEKGRNGMTAKPECRLRGDDHWTHRRPDLVPRGASASRAGLEEADAIEIRRRYDTGEPLAAIAAQYGISRTSVVAIGKGRAWKHAPGMTGRLPSRCDIGEGNPSAKLNAGVVREIRDASNAGEARGALAKRYGVSRACVRNLVLRRSWASVS